MSPQEKLEMCGWDSLTEVERIELILEEQDDGSSTL